MADPIAAVAEASAPQIAATAQATSVAIATQSLQFQFFGYNINMIALLIGIILIGVVAFAYTIQKSNKLDFADMITFDGRKVSLSKVLQLLGGLTATWVMIKLTLTNSLSEVLFATYLTYVGAIEGYSKFVAAKYGYQETGIRDGGANAAARSAEEGSPIKILKAAEEQAETAEESAKDAKVSIKNATVDLVKDEK